MPRAGRVSDSQATRWLDDLIRATHIGLSLQDPFSVADPLTVEVSAASYARAAVTWSRSGRLNRNSVALSWTGLPANTSLWGLTAWVGGTNGEFVAGMPYALTLPTGGGFTLGVNGLYIGVDQ